MHYLDYNEKQAHGTADFPLAYYYVDEHHPRYHMPLSPMLHYLKNFSAAWIK